MGWPWRGCGCRQQCGECAVLDRVQAVVTQRLRDAFHGRRKPQPTAAQRLRWASAYVSARLGEGVRV